MLKLSDGSYAVHMFASSGPHNVFVSTDFNVTGTAGGPAPGAVRGSSPPGAAQQGDDGLMCSGGATLRSDAAVALGRIAGT